MKYAYLLIIIFLCFYLPPLEPVLLDGVPPPPLDILPLPIDLADVL